MYIYIHMYIHMHKCIYVRSFCIYLLPRTRPIVECAVAPRAVTASSLGPPGQPVEPVWSAEDMPTAVTTRLSLS